MDSSKMTEQLKQLPKRITMPGMIYDANKVLSWILDPKTGGVNPGLFGPLLKGICFINIVEAGFVFSGNVGTGIVLARKPDGSWSPPSAIGITGLGWGFIMGASLKEIVYLIYDENTMNAMTGDVGIKLGTQMEATVGNWGRTGQISSIMTNKGVGANVAISFSQGIFGGVSIEGAVCNPRHKVNEKFYGKKVSPSEILLDGAVGIPEGDHLLNEVYEKLDKLNSGIGIYEVPEDEQAKAERIRVEAEKEGEEHLKEEEVERVDVSEAK